MTAKQCIIRLFGSRRKRLAAAGVLLAALAVCVFLLLNRPAGPIRSNARLTAAAEGLDAYDAVLRLIPEERALSVSETASLRNRTGETLDRLILRTWLNAYQSEETSPAALEEIFDDCYPNGFSPGTLMIYDVLWNGERVAWSYADEAETVLQIDIPSWEAGAEGELFLRCVAYLPNCAHRTGYVGDTYRLCNVIPLLSRWQDGAFRQDLYSPVGDPFVGDCANFTLTAYLPEGYEAACSAVLTRDEKGAWHGEMQAARDVALCVSPDFCRAFGRAGDTAVYSFARTEAGARRVLADAEKALETFGSLYGAYPYPSLTVCSADFPFGGMEYPGLILIGESDYLESKADTLELTVAHETAHQWFYALVGSDQVNDPWQDEGLCEYAMLRYVKARYGPGSFDTLKAYRVDAPMRDFSADALTPGSPIGYFSSLTDYATVVYGRGAAYFLALDEIVPGGLDGFLRSYADDFAFGFASRADFEDALNRYADADLTPLTVDYLDTLMN